MQNNEVIRIDNVEALEALNRSEIDVQVSTAKRYPRNIDDSLKRIEAIATINRETAEECFYALPRDGKTIDGPSIRFAEIVATCWMNLRVATQIIGNDGRMITARGICHDLETNVAFSAEVKRKITGRDGRTFSEDMQVVTGNAAAAIAARNAIFKCVPKAVLSLVANTIRKKAIGDADDSKIPERRAKCLKFFGDQGVSEEMILHYLEVSNVEEIGAEDLFKLTSLRNAVKEGTTSFKSALIDPWNAAQKKAAGEKKMSSAQSKVAEAMKANAVDTQELNDMPFFEN